jgi:hypothetical protein
MMRFRNVAVFIALVGMLFGLVSVADAAHKKSHKKSASQTREMTGGRGAPEMILTGPITSVSPSTGFFVMNHGTAKNVEEIPIEVDDRTTMMRGGTKINIDEIKPGERVRISYTGTAADVRKTIDVAGGPAMKSSRAKPTHSGKTAKPKQT